MSNLLIKICYDTINVNRSIFAPNKHTHAHISDILCVNVYILAVLFAHIHLYNFLDEIKYEGKKWLMWHDTTYNHSYVFHAPVWIDQTRDKKCIYFCDNQNHWQSEKYCDHMQVFVNISHGYNGILRISLHSCRKHAVVI